MVSVGGLTGKNGVCWETKKQCAKHHMLNVREFPIVRTDEARD
jgi:hypothetical protein